MIFTYIMQMNVFTACTVEIMSKKSYVNVYYIDNHHQYLLLEKGTRNKQDTQLEVWEAAVKDCSFK